MRRVTLAAALTLLALGSVATANAQSRHCGQDNRVAGTVIGGLVGATAGGVIANNVRRDRFAYNRGFRGGRGFRGSRGFRRSRRGNQELGIVLGALAGGIVGNQIASNNVRNCSVVVGSRHQGDPFAGRRSHVLAGGDIDHNAARLGDPYGGARVVTTRQAAPVQRAPQPFTQQTPSGVFQPVCETVFRTTDLPNGQRIREPIEVCQFSEGGEWIPR